MNKFAEILMNNNQVVNNRYNFPVNKKKAEIFQSINVVYKKYFY